MAASTRLAVPSRSVSELLAPRLDVIADRERAHVSHDDIDPHCAPTRPTQVLAPHAVRHIDGRTRRAGAAQLGQRARGRFDRGFIARADGDVGALRGECPRNRGPMPSCRRSRSPSSLSVAGPCSSLLCASIRKRNLCAHSFSRPSRMSCRA